MLEIYLKTCNFYVAKNKFDMEYGRKKRFTTAEPELVLLDIGNPEVQKHLDMGVYRGEGFDSLWKFLKGTKHTDMENNLLCFSELRESADAGRRIYLFDHYAGSSERYEYLYKERKEPELCWKRWLKKSIALTIGNWKPAKNCANVQDLKATGKMLMQILLRKSSIMLLKFSV